MRRGALLAIVLVACGDGDPYGSDTGGSSGSSSGGSTGVATTGVAGDTTGRATTQSGASDDSGGSDGGTTTGAPFGLDVHTVLTDAGRLALTTNLPPAVDDCLALAGAPCEDADEDGLVDAWEDAVLDRLRPLRRFDEAEALLDDASAVLADVGRVIDDADGRYRLYVMLGYSRDYGSCGVTSHNGDSERVVLALAPYPEGGAGGVVVDEAYTAAHEGTATDHGQVFAGPDLDQLVVAPDPELAEPRWVVFPSRDKHATYATIDICEGISIVPCFEEDCAPDGVEDPAAFDFLPPFGNAGEETAPRLTELSSVGFPGDDAWADQEFCGGLGGTGCSSSVRSKLLTDPF